MNSFYALIMAGGGGTRLWPESRSALPKQFIRLFQERSLIQIAYDRVTPLIPPERILIVTGQRYAPLIKEQLPDLPPENIIAEPAGRNTAPAIGLGAVHLRRRDPAATMAVLTADHLMHKGDVFRAALSAAGSVAASTGKIITLGITPSKPETGFGYIKRADQIAVHEAHRVFQVSSFHEKPDLATAESYLASGKFFWNSGMFIWQVDTILAEIERQLPELYSALSAIEAALGKERERETTEKVWANIKPVSIDFGVMEHARNVAVLPVDPGWNDVGSWSAVYEESLDKAQNTNVVQGAQHLAIDTKGCLIRSDKLVATVGLRDLVIVETDDALLICPRDKTQETKALVGLLKEDGQEKFL